MGMKIQTQKIMDSALLIVQKFHAVKTFVLSMIDFMMLNGDVGGKQLEVMDKYIRGQVDKALTVRGLPVECHHASWLDGGLSLPSLEDRWKVGLPVTFAKLPLSKDKKVKKATEWFTEAERRLQQIKVDELSPFLDWKIGAEGNGTACLAIRVLEACTDLNVEFKKKEGGIQIGKDRSIFNPNYYSTRGI
jgi:hypothetical protein